MRPSWGLCHLVFPAAGFRGAIVLAPKPPRLHPLPRPAEALAELRLSARRRARRSCAGPLGLLRPLPGQVKWGKPHPTIADTYEHIAAPSRPRGTEK